MFEGKTLTQERVRELFTYDPESGILRWRVQRGPNRPGDRAGCRTVCRVGKAYLQVRIDYRLHLAHRVIFLLVTGSMPEEVDHEDGNGENNIWSNLRAVDRLGNRKNCRRSVVNTSGTVGVYWVVGRDRWEAYINVNRKRTYLGRFKDKHEAISRRKAAEVEFGFHVNHGSDRPL